MKNKYQLVAQSLCDEIRSGVLELDNRLPSYQDLCRRFEVSEITIRHAVDVLVREGWLRGRRGRGNGFFVNHPELSRRGENGRLRRIALYIRWPFLGSGDSDFPVLQKGLSQTALNLGFGVEVMPRQDEAEMLSMLRLWRPDERPDGLLLLPQHYEPTLALLPRIRKYRQSFLLLNSAQTAVAENLRSKGFPGIYVDELTALRRLLAVARERGITTLQLVGIVEEALGRVHYMLRWLSAENEFHIESCFLNDSGGETMLDKLRRQVTLCTTNRKRLMVVEGTGRMLTMLDVLLEMTRMKPGRDLSVAFIQHYCDLRAEHLERYSSLSRPLEKIGRIAIEQLVARIRHGTEEQQTMIAAEFTDRGTI